MTHRIEGEGSTNFKTALAITVAVIIAGLIFAWATNRDKPEWHPAPVPSATPT